MSRNRTKIYIGNLGNNGSESELDSTFGRYGELRSVWVARQPAGFAFIEFEDPYDAEEAVRNLDDTMCCGSRIRVEFSTMKSRGRGGPPPRRRYDRYDTCYNCGRAGHYAKDCTRRGGGGRRRSRSRSRSPRRRRRSYSRGRSYSRSPKRSRGRSRSRSRSRSASQSRRRSRSGSPAPRSRSRSRSKSPARDRSRSRSKSKSKARSASPGKDDEQYNGAD